MTSSSATPMRPNSGGRSEQPAELPVPADQIEVLVEHRDALAHMVDGRLQQVAAVLDGFRRIVEQRDGAGPVAGAPLQQLPQHQPRRRRPDGARQQMLGKAQGANVGFSRASSGVLPLANSAKARPVRSVPR
jgi:hypothetical protein